MQRGGEAGRAHGDWIEAGEDRRADGERGEVASVAATSASTMSSAMSVAGDDGGDDRVGRHVGGRARGRSPAGIVSRHEVAVGAQDRVDLRARHAAPAWRRSAAIASRHGGVGVAEDQDRGVDPAGAELAEVGCRWAARAAPRSRRGRARARSRTRITVARRPEAGGPMSTRLPTMSAIRSMPAPGRARTVIASG